jgi:hypothetical protein
MLLIKTLCSELMEAIDAVSTNQPHAGRYQALVLMATTQFFSLCALEHEYIIACHNAEYREPAYDVPGIKAHYTRIGREMFEKYTQLINREN